ncbi:hypothetical protein L484_008515 [Morus notabilis]|uniref:Uncharacterized protein n=1 Tax=Morus notabilis TaxID=981085 RepID=W9RJB4_9ROSA|nr:hypothetical protein L484_008515 [Morus notabilis]
MSRSGNCQCAIQDIQIARSRTGELVENKPEWSVTIKNECSCTQLDLHLDCNGYQTVKLVDPSILSISNDGQYCLVNNGQPIYAFGSISFTYAWDTSFPFRPISSQIACS